MPGGSGKAGSVSTLETRDGSSSDWGQATKSAPMFGSLLSSTTGLLFPRLFSVEFRVAVAERKTCTVAYPKQIRQLSERGASRVTCSEANWFYPPLHTLCIHNRSYGRLPYRFTHGLRSCSPSFSGLLRSLLEVRGWVCPHIFRIRPQLRGAVQTVPRSPNFCHRISPNFPNYVFL
jgi:hypothetical protein